MYARDEDALKPPESLTVLMNTWKADCRGIDAEATDIATTKLPRMPTFCSVRQQPRYAAVVALPCFRHNGGVVSGEKHGCAET